MQGEETQHLKLVLLQMSAVTGDKSLNFLILSSSHLLGSGGSWTQSLFWRTC